MRILKSIDFEIAPDQSGIRLDKALGQHPEVGSRSLASKLIAWECVNISGELAKASRITKAGEVYSVKLPAKEFEDLSPYDHPLEILHEDEDVIVVNKPTGMVVHPAAGHYQDTLINALIYHNKNLSAGSSEFRPGLVHRLDKDTSGVIVLAKNDRAHRALAAQFKAKTTHRRYEALCFGIFHKDNGRIETHLKRHPVDRKRWASVKERPGTETDGKIAVTNFRVLNTHPCGVSFVELHLETGRTHQIRVHLSEQGHGIVGDPIYAQKNRAKNLKGQRWQHMLEKVPRLMLHAAELGFTHPDGQSMKFQVGWPSQELVILKALGMK